MLYRAKAILIKGSVELGGNRVRTDDCNRPQGCSIPYDIKQKVFWRGWKFISLSSAAHGLTGHGLGDGEQLLVHHPLYIHIYIVITIILFSILANSFIWTHGFYFFFQFSPPSHWEVESEQMSVRCTATCWAKPQHLCQLIFSLKLT